VAALMIPVTMRTRNHNGATLLVVCSLIWLACWLLFAAPLVVHGSNAQFVLAGFVVLAIGDTLMAPVLPPLAADLAPEHLRARSLAAVSGTSNLAIAIGPLLASLLLGLNLRSGYVVLQMVACVGAAGAALRLRTLMREQPGEPVIKTHVGAQGRP
jgi:MFS family permease